MKKMRSWCMRLLVVTMTAVAAGMLWAATVVICPKCGYESDGTSAVCAHCGGPLPISKNAVPVTTTPTPAAEGAMDEMSAVALKAARDDVKQAKEFMASRPEISYAFYENAIALSRLVKRIGEAGASSGKSMVAGLEYCLNVLTHANRPCPQCGGSGKRNMQFQALGGDKNSPAMAAGLTCPMCNGSGTIRGGRSTDELRVLIGQGRRDFETRQEAAGRVACGRTWVPADLAAKLNVRQQALLRTACPTPCPDCMGLGVMDCPHCKGVGRLKCNNDGCKDGYIMVKVANTITTGKSKDNSSAITRREMCPVCAGTGFMPCPDCHAGGTVPCKTCHGTGRNASCVDCGGQGWVACVKCHGTGKQGDGTPCPECQGLMEHLCARCHGEGSVPK
jgi:DnaJ-class molecular chaperone